ncbi:MAG: hypothetical protein JWM11_6803 [Planctomycetaceae bacterium]|nr:hypothetical protein [Planctomycetaceae bacterium]
MFQRRVPLAILVGILVVGAMTAADASGRRRGRHSQRMNYVYNPSSPVGGQAGGRPVGLDPVLGICPMFPYANHGTYCSWYAIPCSDGVQQTPVSYDASCSAGPTTPCSCPPPVIGNLLPYVEGYGIDGATYGAGIGGPLGFPTGISPGGEFSITSGNDVFWVGFATELVQTKNVYFQYPPNSNPVETHYVQLLKVKVTPDASGLPDMSASSPNLSALKKTITDAGPLTKNTGHEILMQRGATHVDSTDVTPVYSDPSYPYIVWVRDRSETPSATDPNSNRYFVVLKNPR